MKKNFFLLLLFAGWSIIGCSCTNETEQGENTEEQTSDSLRINLATFNIRYETSENDSQNNWINRKHRVKQIIEQYDFDVFGINEMRSGQYNDMKTMLPAYAYYAIGRDKG